MESGLSEDHQNMLVSFMEITACDSPDNSRQFLQVTNWDLEDAIQLFYVGNDGGGAASTSGAPLSETYSTLPPQSSKLKDIKDKDEDIRPPLPVKREALYADSFLYGNRAAYSSHQPNSVVSFRDFADEAKHAADVWDSNGDVTSTVDGTRDNLASLYRPPFSLMYQGTFEQAKVEASKMGKWLIVNVQSTKEFSSHMLNRDTWSNEAVAQTISGCFIFWQIYDVTSEGKKVCTYYNLVSIPVVLVIDPTTGQKMRSWCGMVGPERMLEDLLPYLDKGPMDHHTSHPSKRMRENAENGQQKSKASSVADDPNEEDEDVLKAIAASLENVKQPAVISDEDKQSKPKDPEPKVPNCTKATYPPLPDEPNRDNSLLCKVLVRLPDGRRHRRNFLLTDPIKLLWSLCCSISKEAESRPFLLTQAIPGASKQLDYYSNLSFAEADLSNSMVSLRWE